MGLYTADWFLASGAVFFEAGARVDGLDPALPRAASTTCTAARCCTTNDPAGLRRTFAEIFRVLRPGGRLLMVNETLKTMRDPTRRGTSRPVAEYEGYEHAHWAARYRWGCDPGRPDHRGDRASLTGPSSGDAGVSRAGARRCRRGSCDGPVSRCAAWRPLVAPTCGG